MIQRRLAIVLSLLSLLLALPLPAQAFQGARSGGWMQVQQQYQPNDSDRQRHSQQRRQDTDRQQREHRESRDNAQRMSPDERRQLRQDLRNAGRDVYPQRRNQR